MKIIILIALLAFTADAQTRRRTKPATKPATTTTTPVIPSTTVIEIPAPVSAQPKKNERPASNGTPAAAPTRNTEPTYFYEFTHPEFAISKIVIEHDDAGRGTIRFTKRSFDETVSDPLQVSPGALERINAAYTALNFLDSNASYQYEKDYSHLGTIVLRLKREAKQRTTSFNYTPNKDARALADEYRKLSNQYVWIFDITVARENQPLDAPRLMDSLDSFIRRNEISDPVQMLPLLKELSNDERVPLIARNHAGKLVDRISKR